MQDYPPDTILVVEVGSTAHGTGLPGKEDHDETVVFIEPPEVVLGLNHAPDAFMQRTKPEGARSEPDDTDRQCYSLRKFCRLAADGNPSILMTFWAPVLREAPLGEQLRALAPAFVGRHVLPKYRGYMASQISRMKGEKGGHGHRGGGKREELVAEHGYDTKFAMHAARLGFQGLELVTTGRLELPIPGEAGEFLRAVRRGEVALDDFFAAVDALDNSLGLLMKDEQYAAGPDTERINRYLNAAHFLQWDA